MSDTPRQPPTVINAKPREIAPGFSVRRVLPAAQQRSVGPFVFLDHMGPVQFDAGHAMEVGAHPHIGLCTLTYLLEGRVVHRDSVGSVQRIVPGDVNWMTAGRGVSHSERTAPEDRGTPQRVHGLQLWVAMPADREEDEPAFEHHPAHALPQWTQGRATLRLAAGNAYGRVSPVAVLSPMFLVHADVPAGSVVAAPTGHQEAAVYVLTGSIRAGGVEAQAGTLLVVDGGTPVTALTDAALAFLGGEKLPQPRHMWWNFVSTRRERIEQAKADWTAQRIPLPPGETDAIPLPPR